MDSHGFPDATELNAALFPIWRTWVTGIPDDLTGTTNHDLAAGIWWQWRKGYLRTKQINVLTVNADWFSLTMADWGGDFTQDGGHNLALKLGDWATVPKKRGTFRIPVVQENMGVYIGQKIKVADQRMTAGNYYRAIIVDLALDPIDNQIQVRPMWLSDQEPE